MKNLNLKLASVFTCFLLTVSTFAQNWQVGGNNNNQLGGMLQPTIGTNQYRPLLLITNSVERMRINANGFIGLNNTTPNFHLDINTPEIFGGELLFRARVAGDATASMNIINLSGENSTIFVPALFGLQSSATTGSAFTTIGSIDNSQDLTGLPPISRFFSARDYDPAGNDFSIDRVNVLQNRPLFQWLNTIDGLMLMDPRGF